MKRRKLASIGKKSESPMCCQKSTMQLRSNFTGLTSHQHGSARVLVEHFYCPWALLTAHLTHRDVTQFLSSQHTPSFCCNLMHLALKPSSWAGGAAAEARCRRLALARAVPRQACRCEGDSGGI
mmetsp:Transcript_152457/g.487147  ORF Transcript_152457/g.487147 Transcript_152457/m.487147 type:complete len:124 (+) Transcript_152457:30-401(+)